MLDLIEYDLNPRLARMAESYARIEKVAQTALRSALDAVATMNMVEARLLRLERRLKPPRAAKAGTRRSVGNRGARAVARRVRARVT